MVTTENMRFANICHISAYIVKQNFVLDLGVSKAFYFYYYSIVRPVSTHVDGHSEVHCIWPHSVILDKNHNLTILQAFVLLRSTNNN